MTNIIYLVVGIVVGYFVGKFFGGVKKKSVLVQEQEAEKKRNLERIVGYFAGREQVSNNEIEQLLGVSDATAERYLDELEHSGQIRQIGRTGKQVTYEKI